MRQRRLKNEINVVPYIDVMLVLLVIFMVAAPMMTTANIDLPSVGKAPQAPVAPLEIAVKADESLSLTDRSGNANAVKEIRIEHKELIGMVGKAQERNPEHSREQHFRALHRFRRAERGRLVADHAGGAKEQDRRDDAGAQRHAAGQQHLRRRRRAGARPGVGGDQPPQRLSRERHAEHALGRVELFAAALEVQQQQAVAERVQHRRREHAQRTGARQHAAQCSVQASEEAIEAKGSPGEGSSASQAM